MSLRKTIVFTALAAILVFALAGCSPAFAGSSLAPRLLAGGPAQAVPTQQIVVPANTGISVTGVGQVSASPDIARVVIGVETQGDDIKKAISDNNTKMNALISTVKAAGIADKDIQTQNYSVSVENPQPVPVVPASETTTKPTVIYHVSNQVLVTVRDLAKLSDLLDQAVSSGANTIYGINFDVSNPDKLVDQARSLAVADAKARAEKLAQLEGVTLGNVVFVNEFAGNPVPLMANSFAMAKAAGGAPIEGGNIQITVNLQVTYAIK